MRHLLATLALIISVDAHAQYYRVLPRQYAVVDGDTLRQGSNYLRLASIDAPEMLQTCIDAKHDVYKCGVIAKLALTRMIEDHSVHCTDEGKDKYGRRLATCRNEQGNINAAMVSSGWAVAFYTARYMREHLEARREKRGMWAGEFTFPYVYRKEMKGDKR